MQMMSTFLSYFLMSLMQFPDIGFEIPCYFLILSGRSMRDISAKLR